MKFREYNQKQPWLIPPNIEDEIPMEDICRVIDDVIEAIDIRAFEANYGEEGNRAYHPKMMLKILFYSYTRGVFSSRKIASELERNIFYWYLSGKQKPDFRTICLFRRKHAVELQLVFQEVVRFCLNLGLAEISMVAIDGTKIKGNAARDKTRDKAWLEKRIAEETGALGKALEEADRIDAEEDEKYGQDKRGDELPEAIRDRKRRLEKLTELKDQLNAEKRRYINETDVDAGLIRIQGGYIIGYNCQAVTDTKSQVILMAGVSNKSNDWNQLKCNVDQLKDSYGIKPSILLADAGYASGENFRYLKEEKIEGIIPDKSLREIDAELIGDNTGTNEYDKGKFNYISEKDIYFCPKGQELHKTSSLPSTIIRKSGEAVSYFQFQCKECSTCEVKFKCCRGKRGRCITRYSDQVLREEMALRIRSQCGLKLYRRRMEVSEPVFGNIKHNLGFRVFRLRGMIKTRGEFFILAIVHNLIKIQGYLKKAKAGNMVPRLAYLRA
jgi:transposase